MLLPPALLATPASPPLLITPNCDDPEPLSPALLVDEPPKLGPPPNPDPPEPPNIDDFKSEPLLPAPLCPFEVPPFCPVPFALAGPLPMPDDPLAPEFCAVLVDPFGFGNGRSPSLIDSTVESVAPPFAFISGPRRLGCCTITSGGAFESEDELNNPPLETPLLFEPLPKPLLELLFPKLPLELFPKPLLELLLPKLPLELFPKPLLELPPKLLPKLLPLELLLPNPPLPNEDPLDVAPAPFGDPFCDPFCPGSPSCWLIGTFESVNIPFGPACSSRQSALPVNGSGYSLRRNRMLLVFSKSLKEAG
jgi:hypothetical protein